MNPPPLCLLLFLCAGISGCELPPVKLETADPLKVDISMKLDVYNHGNKEEKKDAEGDPVGEAKRRKYNRTEQLNRLRGTPALAESHRGLLVLRESPPPDIAAWAQDLVAEENSDRMTIMTSEAQEQRRDLHEIQDERWRENVMNAQKGEWVEIPDPDNPGRWKYDVKKSEHGQPWPLKTPELPAETTDAGAAKPE